MQREKQRIAHLLSVDDTLLPSGLIRKSVMTIFSNMERVCETIIDFLDQSSAPAINNRIMLRMECHQINWNRRIPLLNYHRTDARIYHVYFQFKPENVSILASNVQELHSHGFCVSAKID